MDQAPVVMERGTLGKEWADIFPNFRYRKRKMDQGPIHTPGFYDDHIRVFPNQEYPRWLRPVHEQTTKVDECVDYEIVKIKMDHLRGNKIKVLLTPNQYTEAQEPLIVFDFFASDLIGNDDVICDYALREAFARMRR